ncbi:hypothetical protein [Amycolatopsis sp. cmx-11-12]|uniref:hypothetical protein n=1 Tax=Amycolatopsis sp. cmx-11-12 TaxID=2785795 RepID=UPI003917CAC5
MARALALLGSFRNGEEVGNPWPATGFDCPVSTTLRLVTALVDAGFWRGTLNPDRYRIGGALAEYGQIAYRQHNVCSWHHDSEQLETRRRVGVGRDPPWQRRGWAARNPSGWPSQFADMQSR